MNSCTTAYILYGILWSLKLQSFKRIKNKLISEANNPLFLEKVFSKVDYWHRNHYRKSGAPYIKHLYETAYQLYLWGFSDDIVAVGLLHDCMEDQNISFEELKSLFGEKIAEMVNGLTKIKKLSNEESQNKLETYRKFFQYLDKPDGLYVLAVKLADRLNNLHELAPLRKEKRLRIVSESISFYFPLTERLGAIEIANKILKIYFQNAQLEEFNEIVKKLKQVYADQKDKISRHRMLLKRIFRESNTTIFIEPYSLYDIYTRGEEFARKNPFIFKILIKDSDNPHHFLDFFSTQYHYHIETEDYWTSPKISGYRGIIGRYIDPEIGNLEIRIEPRSHALINQLGFIYILSHEKSKYHQHLLHQYQRAIHQISERLEEIQEPDELYELMIDTFEEKKIIVITPKNDIVSMPYHSTALDFAFKIHTDLGKSAKKIYVNDMVVPFNYQLKNGDKVFVEKAGSIQIAPNWYHWVNTYTARKEIRRHLKKIGQFDSSKSKEVSLILGDKEYRRFLTILQECKEILSVKITHSHQKYFIKVVYLQKDGKFSNFLNTLSSSD